MFKPDEDWNTASPQDIPPPTYWPAIISLGVALIFWGFLTVFLIGFLGAAVFIVGLTGWIYDLQNAITSNEKNDSS